MLNAPTQQLICLALLELMMIAKRVKFRECFTHKLLLFLSVFNGIIRLYFQITTFLYDFLDSERAVINEKYHSTLIFLIISKIIIDFLASISFKIMKFIQRHHKSKNRVQNVISKEKKHQNSNSKKGKNKKIVMQIIHC